MIDAEPPPLTREELLLDLELDGRPLFVEAVDPDTGERFRAPVHRGQLARALRYPEP